MLKSILLLVAVAVAGDALAQATYFYRDRDGNRVYSDQPPPAGTPYTVEAPGKMPAMPQSGVPATPPLPTVQQPATPALPNVPQPGSPPSIIPQSAVPVDPSAARDRRAFESRDELQTERRDMQRNVPIGEAARDVRDVQLNVPADDAARERRDMQRNVPADEQAREREAVKLNQ